MAIVGELLTLISGNNTALLAAVAQSEAALKGYSATATTQGTAASAAMHGIGIAAIATGALAVAGLGLSVRAAADFQEQMAIINTIAHQTPEELARTGESIRAMAVATGTPLADLTKAFYDLLSAGVPASEAMGVLGQATTLAIGGLATTTQTVDLLTTAINAYHLDAQGAATATDQFALAVQNGKVTADQIAATFAEIAPIAKTAGIGIDEIAAGYAHFTANGVPAAEFTTQMNRAIVELLKPGKDLLDLQEATGKNFAEIASERGLVVALQEMRVAAEQNGVPFQDLFGRLEGYKFALQTTGPEFAAYTSQLSGMHDATGTAAAQAAERMGTFERQTAILGASINSAAISIGNALLPAITSIVESVSGAVTAFTAWSDANPGLAANILLVVAAVGALAVVVTAIGAVLGILTSPITLVVVGLVALGAAFATNFGGIRTTVTTAIGAIAPIISTVLGGAINVLSTVIGTVVGWIATFITRLTGTSTGSQALNVILTATSTVLGAIATVVGTVVGALTTAVTWFVTSMNAVGSFRIAGNLINATLGIMGTTINVLITALLNVAGIVGGAVSIAFTALKAVFDAIVTAIRAATAAIGGLIKGAQDAAAAIAKIPGVSLVGEGVHPQAQSSGHGPSVPSVPPVPSSAFTYGSGDILRMASGGIVPGSPGQAGLAVLHGGETVTPAGQGVGATRLTHTTIVQLDGRTLGQVVEELLFDSASAYSSGFTASPATTGV